jgi:hypothetical protein
MSIEENGTDYERTESEDKSLWQPSVEEKEEAHSLCSGSVCMNRKLSLGVLAISSPWIFLILTVGNQRSPHESCKIYTKHETGQDYC